MNNSTFSVAATMEQPHSLAPKLLVTACISAFVSHQTFFKRVEVDYRPVSLAASFIFAYFALAKCFGFLLAFLTLSCFLVSLWADILVYRLIFHPLKRFPGPTAAKLSKLWTLKQVLDSNYQWYKVAQKLNVQYGDYVRTGPRELLIFDPAAIGPVLGFASKTLKGPFYDSMEDSISTTRDKEFHRKRRKIWDNAFKQSLAEYGPRIEEFTDKLLIRIESNISKPILLNKLVIHYSYDVMSTLAYGKSMGFVEGKSTEVADSILRNIMDGVYAIGLLLHIPWLMTVLTTFSFMIGPMKQWNLWSEQQLEERRKLKDPKPDIMGHLLAHTPSDRAGRSLLFSESRIIVSAGSDTTATALTFIFVNLARFPQHLRTLRAELDATAATYSCLKPQPVLDGIINESLRLYPSVFFPSQRETPPEGLRINDVFIPGNTIIGIAAYALARDARSFVRPDEFIPERWHSQSELVLNKTAFMPFMHGPYDCAGKKLAMMELRSVVARTVREFDVRFVEGKEWDAEKYFGAVKDHFIAGAPQQWVIFEKREV